MRGNGGTRGTVAFEKAPQNFYEKGEMDIVCASPIAHQYCSVQYMRRSFASGWTEPSALYGERLLDTVYCGMVEYRLRGAIAVVRIREPLL